MLLHGQRVFTTFAGSDWVFPGDGKAALNAPLSGSAGLDVVVDGRGNYYIADSGNNMVMRVGPDGIVQVVAGNGFDFASGDGGLAVNAGLFYPNAIALDSAGNLYVTGFENRVRKVATDGKISTIAGTGASGYSGDGGPAVQAMVQGPQGIAVDGAGNVYFSDTGNHRIRKIGLDGIITTVAGVGVDVLGGENVRGTETPVSNPRRMKIGPDGNLYFIENSERVRGLDGTGTLRTVAGGGFSEDDNIPATSAALLPLALAFDTQGNLYLASSYRQGVYRVELGGVLRRVAGGTGGGGFGGDGGPALDAQFRFSFWPGLAVDGSGNIFVGDDGNAKVRRISSGTVQTVAGNGLFRLSGNNGPARSATLELPMGMVRDAVGNLYIAEPFRHRVRRVSADGTISIVAGTGIPGLSGDGGQATQARLNLPISLAVDGAGTLYIADTGNCRIRAVDASGTIRTQVGTTCGFSGDGGPAAAAQIDLPEGVISDAAGNLVIAGGNRLRLAYNAPNLTMATLAGDGIPGFSGDGGVSTGARVNGPTEMALFAGYLFFSDTDNHRVRYIDLDSLEITTAAGNGEAGYSGDGGLAEMASLDGPLGLAADADLNLYIVDANNGVIRRVTPGGTISTVAGLKGRPPLREGALSNARSLGFPQDIVIDPAGTIVFSENLTNRVWALPGTAPTYQTSVSSLSLTAQQSADAAERPVNAVGSVAGLNFSTVTSATWLTVVPSVGILPAELRIVATPGSLGPGTYQGTVTITVPAAQVPVRTVAVSFTVTAPGEPRLDAAPQSMRFTFVQPGVATVRPLEVANRGGGTLSVQATTSTSAGGNWLRVPTGALSVGPFASVPLNVTADPTGLAAGTYSGAVTLASANPVQSVVTPVTMVVTTQQQSIVIPESGLTFFAVQGGGAPPFQFFTVLNGGRGEMAFTTSASTLAGGPWLGVFPQAGLSDAGSTLPPQIRVGVNPQGLTAGIYYGRVQVNAGNADNSPQFVSVVLQVLAPGSRLRPIVQPSGLLFTAVAGGRLPNSQTVVVQGTDLASISFTSARATETGGPWFTVLPESGSVSASEPTRIVVQPLTGDLVAGVYRGTLKLSFSDGTSRLVSLVLVLAPAGTTLSLGRSAREAGDCTPTTLVPIFTQLASGFSSPVGFPGSVAVKVVDDCGSPMTDGGVVVSFSNGDPPLRLTSLLDGSWAETWVPFRRDTPVTVTADASFGNLTGRVKVTGELRDNQAVPIVDQGAIVNGASFALGAPLAPGSVVSLFGSELAQGFVSATTVPIPFELGGSTILLGGKDVPVFFASTGQVNAIVPYGLRPNTEHQLIVSRGTQLSTPQKVTIAAAAPGIFLANAAASKQGIVVRFRADGQFIADASHPLKAGDVMVIYCTGLGDVDPAVTAGVRTPGSPISQTVNPVTATLGGVNAPVGFAGLTPGQVGLYQINATVPEGVAKGSAVELVLTVAGQKSVAVTVAVE